MKKNYCISIISLLKLMRKFLKILEREKRGLSEFSNGLCTAEEEDITTKSDGCGCRGKVGFNFRFFKYVVNDQALPEIVYP